MNFFEKIFDKLSFSFIQRGNKKKIIKQNEGGLQICQEKQSITNIFQIQNLNVESIKQLAGFDVPQNSENLLKSAGQRFLIEQQTKQENFKEIVEKAELQAISEPQEIEKDWFLKWMEISQGVSREDVQNVLAKIISGEIKKSGSFSLRTLEILKNLSKNELILFQKICDISYSIPQFGDMFTCVMCEPFGSPGDNSLEEFGLGYSNLIILQDAGLIHTDLTAWRETKMPLTLLLPFTIGSDSFEMSSIEGVEESKPKFKIINFTIAGLELRSVLNLGNNSIYCSKFLNWIQEKYKITQQVKNELK